MSETLHCARWLLPIAAPPIENGAIAIDGSLITAVGAASSLKKRFPLASVCDYGEAAILPGLVNTHSHLELTAMRGFLDSEEGDFLSWLKKLTITRLESMTADDLYVSAAWGACEAVRAGITCIADASDSAYQSMSAVRDVGLRGIVFQESFGPDPRLARENVERLAEKVDRLKELETSLVRRGVSPHAPYTVSAPQLALISSLALEQRLPLMIHAAESKEEGLLLRDGSGPFAESLQRRGIEWKAPRLSTIQYLKRHRVLETHPLLAHCIRVDSEDVETIKEAGASVAHCPKSNAKLGHGRAPLALFRSKDVVVGLGSDSVASNGTCDLLEEGRFASLLVRLDGAEKGEPQNLSAGDVLRMATLSGAEALGLANATGSLREGLQADFTVISLLGTHQTPIFNPAAALAFSSGARDVVATFVGGREVFLGGRIPTIDEERLSARMKEVTTKWSKQ